MNANMKIGLLGLVIQIAINLIALLVFKKSSAGFFSEQWWSAWFPGYTVWLVFLVLGLILGTGKNGSGEP